MRRHVTVAVSGALLLLMLFTGSAAAQAAAGPIVVVETSAGTFEFETYPGEAPKTVAHIVGLVKRNFYDGIKIHRVVPGFVMQFGDPLTRDMAKKQMWGSGGSGTPIDAAEMNPKRTHSTKGMVAMAHAGNPAKADSQMYITLAPQPRLDSDYTVFGRVISGMDVVEKIKEMDVVTRVTIKS